MTLRGFCIFASMFVYTMGVSADYIKNVTASNVTYSSAEINWDTMSGDTKWNVRYKPVAEGNPGTITLTLGSMWTDGSG